MEAESPAIQVNCIVDGIQREMAVDACSLYLLNDSGDLVLVASHGLGSAAVGRAVVPVGKGLVGEVAATRHPINITEPATHPAFHYVAGSGEEQFRSFCAVPLVRGGAVIGVLAVQRRAPEILGTEDEAFLVTLGAQLALVVANWEDWQLTGTHLQRAYSGVRGAPGVGLGKVLLCEELDLFSVPDKPCADAEAEIRHWRDLLQRVQTEVMDEQAALDGELSAEVNAIFDAYRMLLADPTLGHGVEDAIRRGHDLPSALRAVVNHYAELFMAMEDPYLRARHEDIRHLGNRLYGSWKKSGDEGSRKLPDGPLILVGSQVSVSDIAGLPRARLAGIVSKQGSSLSHTAVLANALGIPAVLGTGEFKGISEGDAIVVDGHAARVFLQPDDVIWAEYSGLREAETALSERLRGLRDKPARTRDGETVSLFANSGLTADIYPGVRNGAEGLGLYRTEIPFMTSETFPSEDEQFRWYSEVIRAYSGKPVYMRTLDVGADKPLPYFPIQEENPALGWRGIRFCLDNASLLVTQLRAMLRASVPAANLKIMLPMVSAIAELRDFHKLLDETIAQLRAEGVDVARPQVGIMVEVPAAISQLEKWREYVEFISIGTNDLSQYLTAVDRNNPRVSARYDHLHPAVLAEISRVLAVAERLGLPVSVCGEMASDPDAVVLLVGMGIRTLSMSAAQLPKVKWLIMAMDCSAARKLFEAASNARDSAEIRGLASAFIDGLEYPAVVH